MVTSWLAVKIDEYEIDITWKIISYNILLK